MFVADNGGDGKPFVLGDVAAECVNDDIDVFNCVCCW